VGPVTQGWQAPDSPARFALRDLFRKRTGYPPPRVAPPPWRAGGLDRQGLRLSSKPAPRIAYQPNLNRLSLTWRPGPSM
jgi:hypothetical protein